MSSSDSQVKSSGAGHGSGRAFVEGFLQDLRFGMRQLGRSPGFAVAVVLTLALGIGASTAIFSLIDALMLRSLPVAAPAELFAVGDRGGSGTMLGDSVSERDDVFFSHALYSDLRNHNEVFAGLAALSSYSNTVYLGPDGGATSRTPQAVEARLVSGNFFSVLGVRPALGRVLTAADDENVGAHPVVVISHGFWARQFGLSPDAVGAEIRLNDTAYRIVGVAPERFSGVTVGHTIDVWVPMMMQPQILRAPSQLEDRNTMWLRLVGRLLPDVSPEQARLGMTQLFQSLVRDEAGSELTPELDEEIAHATLQLVPFDRGFSGLRRRYAQPLMMLLVVVGLVLLIACANVGNLLLARASGRQREIALRLAVGSSRGRIVRQLLTESLLLALLAGSVSVLASRWLVDFLLVLISRSGSAVPLEVRTDARVLGFALLVSVLSAVLFGLAPAFATVRGDIVSALKSQGAMVGADHRGRRLRRALVVSQVAVSLLLLIGAGLFLRSLQKLRAVDPGFEIDGAMVAQIDPRGGGYPPEQLPELYERVVAQVEAVPGIESASMSLFGLLTNSSWRTGIVLDGYTPGEDEEMLVRGQVVMPTHFETMRIPLVRGRYLATSDREGAPQVALVNQTFAHRFFGGDAAVGRRFGLDDEESARDIEIVGVVGDVKYNDLREETPPVIYVPVLQSPESLYALEVRTTLAPRAAADAIKAAVNHVAPGLPVMEARTFEERLNQSLRQESVVSRLTGGFGLLALLLAATGLYGVLAYAVSQRTAEIGVRIALGADRRQVYWLVLEDAAGLVGAGIALGLVAALASTRLVSSMLYGLGGTDPTAILAATACLATVALVAAYLPARRASRLDPLVALRHE